MIKLCSKLISWIKREPFELDRNLTFGYLVNFIGIKLMSLLRGIIRLGKFKSVFIGANTKIFAAYLMKFGQNVSISEDCHIDALSKNGIVFGDNVSIQKRTIIECTGSLRHLGEGLVIGNNVGIGSNSFLGCAGGIRIGEDTIIGNYVSFHSENHNFDRDDIPIRRQGVNHKGIVIGKNCWIGAKVTILDGTTLGDGCVVAAGAVLSGKEYPRDTIIAGVPAKVLKSRLIQ